MHAAGGPPRRNKHAFTAPALGLFFGFLALVMGVDGVLEARNNPTPTAHDCRKDLVAELGRGAWVDVSACEPDLDNAVLMFGDSGGDAVFIPLVHPVSGEQAGILKTDDPLVLEALNATGSEPDGPPSDAELAAASVLFATPRTGMTVRLSTSERKILTKGLRGLGEDDPVIELGEVPHPTRSLVILILGIVGLAASGWGVRRAKRIKDDEKAQLAAWHAAAGSQNPYAR